VNFVDNGLLKTVYKKTEYAANIPDNYYPTTNPQTLTIRFRTVLYSPSSTSKLPARHHFALGFRRRRYGYGYGRPTASILPPPATRAA